ncbi:flagellar hook-length control protein FliK [Izhakiella capsodis]|uniref:Flagellar hook-length control protein FliK n=1 Tax=Izhakiella capsodis TaxID=1367852 RepID=A0A1I5ALU8_9GAMM|nr:flagellar hook-length control protein FliK [Izhakiella capsodis]SFN63427.1 flagellar hook-length control protein FliK [Izhakiella capsodis]
MITLPVITTHSGRTTNSTAVGSDPATADQALLTPDGAPQGHHSAPAFLQILGDRLVSLVKHHNAVSKTTAVNMDVAQTAADAKEAISADLNKLLMTPDTSEALTTLLQKRGNIDEDKTTGQKADTSPSTLNNHEMQALQTLLAMLPQHAPLPAAPDKIEVNELTDGTGSGVKSSKTATLIPLLSPANRHESETGAVKTANNANAGLSAAADKPTPATVPSGEVKSATFEQVFSNMKTSDKESSNSLQNATISHPVMSTASAVQTPTQSAQVTAPPAAQLSAQLGSQEWQHHLGQQVLMFSRNGQHSAELHLHPEDLGSIQISLQLHNDQANLNMVSSHSQVRAALEVAIPHLRHALAESGISLGQSNVSSDAFQQGQAFTGQQEQRNNSRGNTFSLAKDSDSDTAVIAVPDSIQRRVGGVGAVDIFA